MSEKAEFSKGVYVGCTILGIILCVAVGYFVPYLMWVGLPFFCTGITGVFDGI